MNERIRDLYAIPNITEQEDVCLQTLLEHCIVLEEQLRELSEKLSDHERQIVEAYLDARNEMEFQTVKIALRWGKKDTK